MRSILGAILALGSSSASAAAGQCHWVDTYRWWCSPGCWVRETWWEGPIHWMQYSCVPLFLTDPLFIIAVGVLAVIGVITFIASQSSPSPFSHQITEADARAREAEEIARRLKAARAEADRFLQTYRDR